VCVKAKGFHLPYPSWVQSKCSLATHLLDLQGRGQRQQVAVVREVEQALTQNGQRLARAAAELRVRVRGGAQGRKRQVDGVQGGCRGEWCVPPPAHTLGLGLHCRMDAASHVGVRVDHP